MAFWFEEWMFSEIMVCYYLFYSWTKTLHTDASIVSIVTGLREILKKNAPRLCADNVMIKSKNIIARMLKRAIGTVSLSHLSRREKIESIEVERKLTASPKS